MKKISLETLLCAKLLRSDRKKKKIKYKKSENQNKFCFFFLCLFH